MVRAFIQTSHLCYSSHSSQPVLSNDVKLITRKNERNDHKNDTKYAKDCQYNRYPHNLLMNTDLVAKMLQQFRFIFYVVLCSSNFLFNIVVIQRIGINSERNPHQCNSNRWPPREASAYEVCCQESNSQVGEKPSVHLSIKRPKIAKKSGPTVSCLQSWAFLVILFKFRKVVNTVFSPSAASQRFMLCLPFQNNCLLVRLRVPY